MTRPTACLFDLDGTLVDSAITIAAALSALSAARGGPPVDLAQTRRLVSRGAPVLVRESLGPAAGESSEDVAAFRALLSKIPAEAGMIFPGVVAALEALAGANVPCAVVTNKPESLARLLLEQLDLAGFFDMVIGGDSLPVCKPHPAPLRHALRAINLDGRGVMIGDSAVDASAAQAAGMPFVLYRSGYEADSCAAHLCAAMFDDFADLPRMLQRLEIVKETGPQVQEERKRTRRTC